MIESSRLECNSLYYTGKKLLSQYQLASNRMLTGWKQSCHYVACACTTRLPPADVCPLLSCISRMWLCRHNTKTGKCAACEQPTQGIFNIATDILKKIKQGKGS